MSVLDDRRATKAQRTEVYLREDCKCHYCGITLSYKSFHVDHIVPWSKGGRTQLDNLVASCYMCNIAKSDIDYQKFKILLSIKGLDWRRRFCYANKAKFAKI